MIRFVDLTETYWTVPAYGRPCCAFLSTVDNRFLTTEDNQQVFFSLEEVKEHKYTNKLVSLLPPDFFTPKPKGEKP